jgi:hypothetical protein
MIPYLIRSICHLPDGVLELEQFFFGTLLMLKATIYHFPFSKIGLWTSKASMVAHHFVRVFNVSVWHEWDLTYTHWIHGVGPAVVTAYCNSDISGMRSTLPRRRRRRVSWIIVLLHNTEFPGSILSAQVAYSDIFHGLQQSLLENSWNILKIVCDRFSCTFRNLLLNIIAFRAKQILNLRSWNCVTK